LLLQRRMAELLESREAHYLVIGMVLLDLAIVLAELVLSSFYPTPELAPHLGERAAKHGPLRQGAACARGSCPHLSRWQVQWGGGR
jgi:hypothetical protein